MVIIDYNSLKCKTEKSIKRTKYRDSNTLLFIINIILSIDLQTNILLTAVTYTILLYTINTMPISCTREENV